MAYFGDPSQDVWRLTGGWVTNAPPSPSSADVTMESLAATMKLLATLPPPPRDVFRFKGTLEQFKKAVGCVVPTYMPDLPPIRYDPCLGGLQVYEVKGECWIGANPRDIDDAIEGKLPHTLIVDRKTTPGIPA